MISDDYLPPTEYTANGATTNFPTLFEFINSDELVVSYVPDDGSPATTLTEGVNYTVSGGGGGSGDVDTIGSDSPYDNGRIVIDRQTDDTQELDYRVTGSFLPDRIETALDKLTLLIQEAQAEMDRSVRLAATAEAGVDTELPAPTAGAILGWNAAADEIVNQTSGGSVEITPFMATVLDDDSAAAARSTLGAASEDGDKLDIDWDPSNYTPDASPAEADDADALAAHLKGIDDAFGGISGGAVTAASLPAHYERDVRWKVKANNTAAYRYVLVSPSYLTVNINKTGYVLETQQEFDLSTASNWDDTVTTDWPVAANRAGKDFYIYACEPSSGDVPDFILSNNSTVPDAMPSGATPDADNTRKVGGFHCLCADVGANVQDPVGDTPLGELDKVLVSHDITGNTHWMTGFVQGDILPFSVWDLLHRPAKADPEGKFYDAFSGKWVGIYLASWSGSKMESANGATIADGASSPAFHWYNFAELLGKLGERLPFQPEFEVSSLGSPQETNISGSADPGSTGGHSDTAGNRIISLCGGEDMTGVLRQWGGEGGATNDVGSAWAVADTDGTAGSYDNNKSGGRGQHYEAPNRPLFGGAWSHGSLCGSRYSVWFRSPLYLTSYSGARAFAEPKYADR